MKLGEVFGRLTVLELAGRSKHGKPLVICHCSCGSTLTVVYPSLTNKVTKSCGCLKIENAGKSLTTHGKTKTPEYKIWKGIWQRCTNPNRAQYDKYKHRIPPDEWRDFEIFLRDMGLRPTPKHSIERKNNTLPYSSDNCVWATAKEQSANTSQNRLITWQGETLPLAIWAEKYQIPYHRFYDRYVTAGWSMERTIGLTNEANN